MCTVCITAVVVLFLVAIILLNIKKLGLRKFLVRMIVVAEEAFEYGQNDDKFNYVFNQFYQRLPAMIRMLVSQQMIKKFIQETFDEIKLALDH